MENRRYRCIKYFLVPTLLQEFDKLPNDVLVIAATNRFDLLDDAFISRCPIKSEFKPFSQDEKREMLEKFLRSVGFSLSENEISMAMVHASQRDIINEVIQDIAMHIAAGEK